MLLTVWGQCEGAVRTEKRGQECSREVFNHSAKCLEPS